MKEKGLIVNSGMGGFLNPPNHPEHSWHVETDLRKRPENRGGMSLSSAVTSEWLDINTRHAARRKLREWVKLPINAPEVQDWIAQVLGYFRGCYKGDGPEPECWNADKLRIIGNASEEVQLSWDLHAGVHLIRKYYPEYVPKAEDFDRAYWGQKPAVSSR